MPKVTKNNLPRQNQYGPVQGAPDETQIRFLIFVKHILFQNTGQKNFQAVTDAYNREYGTHYKLNALSSQLSRRRIHQDLEVDSTGNVPDEFKEEFQSLVDRFKVKRSLSNDLSTEVSATQDISDVEVSVLGRRQQVRLLEQTNIDGLSTRTRGALGPDDLSLSDFQVPRRRYFHCEEKGLCDFHEGLFCPCNSAFHGNDLHVVCAACREAGTAKLESTNSFAILMKTRMPLCVDCTNDRACQLNIAIGGIQTSLDYCQCEEFLTKQWVCLACREAELARIARLKKGWIESYLRGPARVPAMVDEAEAWRQITCQCGGPPDPQGTMSICVGCNELAIRAMR